MRPYHLSILGLLLLGAASPHAERVHGVVFVDRNGDGIRQRDEAGLRGVAVSNQDAVVVTDSAGRFDLSPGPNRLVFVSEPDGFRSVGPFWRAVTDSLAEIAFPIRPAPAAVPLTFVDASDTHLAPASVQQTRRFRAIVDSVQPDFVLIAGDLVRDALRVSEAEARGYYELAAREFGAFPAPVRLVPGNHENFGIETQLSHVDPANPLFGRAMYHHYFGPDYYSFDRGGVHFIGLNSVDISGPWYYGHVDSLQLAWLRNDLSHVPLETPVVTFNHIPLVSAFPDLAGYTDSPPAPTLITVNGRTVFRHVVSNAPEVLAVLRTHRHVLAIGAHTHVGERVSFITGGVETRFEQSPAIVAPTQFPPFEFPSGVVVYSIRERVISAGRFVPLIRESQR